MDTRLRLNTIPETIRCQFADGEGNTEVIYGSDDQDCDTAGEDTRK